VQRDLDRFLALVCRELGARESAVVEAGSPAAVDDAVTHLTCRTPDGRMLVARFDSAPPDREAMQRRLEMLASTFEALEGDENRPAPSRPPVAEALEQELRALCARAASSNAVVIDANSPIVWGAASSWGLNVLWPATDPREGAADGRVAVAPSGDEADGRVAAAPSGDEADGHVAAALSRHDPDASSRKADIASHSRDAIETVRNLSDIAATRKGRHVRRVEREGHAPYMVHSFAGIYLLLLIYDAPFDELRAERAVIDQLPRIERLVLALPPMDPSPVMGARRGRR
jgi:hypothetical protein